MSECMIRDYCFGSGYRLVSTVVLQYITAIKRIREQRVSAHLLFFVFNIIGRVWVRF